MQGFIVRLLISALGLWLAATLIPSMWFSSGWTTLWAALLLGFVNAFVRPLLVFLTLPITIVSLGVFLIVINAGMLALVATLLPGFALGGFLPAVFASIIVGLTGWAASWFIGPRGRVQVIYSRRDH